MAYVCLRAITTWDLVHYFWFIFFGDGILGVNYELSKGFYGLECCFLCLGGRGDLRMPNPLIRPVFQRKC